ncbi:MAG: restriction endonuclease subunit S, partial [Tissierellia bacterium]|nr:restriction endonuclease subunit S [Tissierellia bacterium]
SIQEQHKISQFLNLINQRIDTQSKIIEDLELFKNMISYKILYDDKTACYKPLSSFSELKNGYAFKSTTYSSKGDYQIVTIANVSGDRYIDLTSSNKILNIPNDIQSHQILKKNDILISLTGNVGRVSYCNKLNCLLNQRVGLLSIKNKDLIEYIFQCIHNKIFEKTMISRGQGVAQLNIGKYDVESFEIPVYSQYRMNTISEVLKLIDFKIIKEKDILELYKKQKAYLLKNMFI